MLLVSNSLQLIQEYPTDESIGIHVFSIPQYIVSQVINCMSPRDLLHHRPGGRVETDG